MWDDEDRSSEARVLDRNPAIRRTVLESPDFIRWRDSLRTIDIDDERLYIRGGDMLKDEDQVIFEWARKNGLLPDEVIDRENDLEGGNPDE